MMDYNNLRKRNELANATVHSKRSPARAQLTWLATLLIMSGNIITLSAADNAADQAFFAKTVLPILEARCFSCHGIKKQKGGLRLDSLSAVLTGGDSGPSAIPGNSGKSLLVQAIKRIGDVQMPPKEPMPVEEIAALEKWVANGMPWTGEAAMPVAMTSSSSADIHFEKIVRPILAERCYECHGSNEPTSGLDLSSRAGVLTGGKQGPAVVLGKPSESLLIAAVRHSNDLKMPRKGKPLSDKEIAALEQWITDGLAWPEHNSITVVATDGPEFTITDQQRAHWSFQPVANPMPPSVRQQAWVLDPIDQFILAPLEKQQLIPAVPADKETLIRRASYDLTGLPPTPEEVADFLSDTKVDAFDRVIDRLLASPRYGERWGRHWLDLVRYADAINYDPKYTHFPAYTMHYRNWVINAFNQDQPYDQFVIQQLAGDLLSDKDGGGRESIIATGVLTLGNFQENDTEREKVRADIVDDQIDLVGRTFMGLTTSCARCHNHKFDPISQADYTALAGIFFSTSIADDKNLRLRYAVTDDAVNKTKRIEDAVVSDARREKKKNGDAPSAEIRAELCAQPLPVAYRAKDGGIPGSLHAKMGDSRLYIRGGFQKQGNYVPRRFPEILAGTSQQPIGKDRSGRLELARWLTQPQHPLTARVIVNRIWQHHFGGFGLVRTPSDFGSRGERPTHPELLDHLTTRFIASGWSMKSLHRLILKSATWQQSSVPTPMTLKADPDNLLLGRQHRWRLQAEAVRDSILAVSGQLDLHVGDLPPWPKEQPAWRTIYLHVSRFDPDPFYITFDGADPSAIITRRETSIVPQQALYLMNNALVQISAQRAADRMMTNKDEDTLARLHLLILGRAPDAKQRALAKIFITRDTNRTAAWTTYAHALLCSTDFIFID